MEQKTLQVGTLVVALALLLRLVSGSVGAGEQAARALILLSSGRVVTETLPPEETEETTESPEQAVQTSGAVPVFGESQAALVQVSADWPVDTLALLEEPLDWSLKAEEPTVLILHSHATESYEKTENYTESSPYRTVDTGYNMVSVGERVAQILEAGGIRVIHDRTLHDYPSYNDAYGHARTAMADYLKQYPSLCLVLDLHRDAREDSSGNQQGETVELEGKTAAKLMLVMGSDKGSLSYPNWQKNLALAVKLQAQLETDYPGLCRPVKLGTSRYNQDLCNGALLVEVGAAGNTRQEAIVAAQFLAQGILSLANGANI